MKLQEVLDSKAYNWEVTFDENDFFKAYFDIYEDDSLMIFTGTLINKDAKPEDQLWELGFSRKLPKTTRTTYDLWNDKDTSITLKIFSTIKDILVYFLNHKDVNFRFIAKEPSRIKLYNRFAKEIASKYHKYNLEISREEHGYAVYTFKHKEID